ncbi:hypothetical protein Hanom_Chr14g01285371 [Helianthus anomalus]
MNRIIVECFETSHLLVFGVGFGGSIRGLQSPSLYLCAYFNISFLCSNQWR